MKRNQSHWMQCLAVSGKKEVFLACQSVSTCHVCRIHQSASHVSISRTPRGRGRTSGVECVSLSVHDTRNFFFTDIYVLFHAHNGQSTISVLPAPNFSWSWFPGLIRVNGQKCRFRKWRKHSSFFSLERWLRLHTGVWLRLNYFFGNNYVLRLCEFNSKNCSKKIFFLTSQYYMTRHAIWMKSGLSIIFAKTRWKHWGSTFPASWKCFSTQWVTVCMLPAHHFLGSWFPGLI